MGKVDASLFTLCTTEKCPLAILCERKHRLPVESNQTYQTFSADSNGQKEGDECDWYIPRDAIASERKVFRAGGRKGMKSNKHVMPHQRKRVTAEELGLQRPDLMVKRHIVKGKDINKEGEGN